MAGMFTGLAASALLYTQTASADTAKTYTPCAAEWSTCSFTGTRVVRYGNEGHFVFKTFTNGTPCRNDAFGSDPQVGVAKSCSLESVTTTTPTTPPPVATSKTYSQCAKEWATCSFSGTKVIRYGDEGHFVFKTFTNGTPCRNDAFGGDPHVGSLNKTCAIELGDGLATTPPPVVTPPPVEPLVPPAPTTDTKAKATPAGLPPPGTRTILDEKKTDDSWDKMLAAGGRVYVLTDVNK